MPHVNLYFFNTREFVTRLEFDLNVITIVIMAVMYILKLYNYQSYNCFEFNIVNLSIALNKNTPLVHFIQGFNCNLDLIYLPDSSLIENFIYILT